MKVIQIPSHWLIPSSRQKRSLLRRFIFAGCFSVDSGEQRRRNRGDDRQLPVCPAYLARSRVGRSIVDVGLTLPDPKRLVDC